MSKDVTEIYDVVPVFAVDESGKALITEEQYSWLCNYAVRKAERLQELEEKLKAQIESNRKLDKINRNWLRKNKRYRELLTSRSLRDLIRLQDKGQYLTEEANERFVDFKWEIKALEGEE